MSPQELQRRVRADDEQLELLLQHSRDLAAIKGDLARILAAVVRPGQETGPLVLDTLTEAAWEAMGVRVWAVGELLARSLRDDSAGWHLDAAIRVTGKECPRSLGQYLARLVPPNAPHQTPGGLELRRCGTSSDGVVLWTVGRL
jgi:hypothetical protein